jgi:hypothetical protein
MEEKKMQRALIHFHRPENHETVKKALQRAGRNDLIPVLLGRGGSRKGSAPVNKSGKPNRKKRKR